MYFENFVTVCKCTWVTEIVLFLCTIPNLSDLTVLVVVVVLLLLSSSSSSSSSAIKFSLGGGRQPAEKLMKKNSIYSLSLCTGRDKAHPITGHVVPEGE
jgi:hypothetical protein